MANYVAITPYQINQRVPTPLVDVAAIGFPTSGCLLRDTSGSPDRSLSTNVSVYSAIQVIATGDLYYCRETLAQLITLFG